MKLRAHHMAGDHLEFLPLCAPDGLQCQTVVFRLATASLSVTFDAEN